MNTKTTNFSQIPKLIQKGIDRYHMVEKGDRILVAVSGGKDSVTMLHALRAIQKKSRLPFELVAIHIKTDFHCGSCVHRETLIRIFENLGVEYVIKHIKVLDDKKQTNCFWCSWNRRKCLFETAQERKCNKIAFGHHKDDVIETTLLNLFYKGEISTMMPRQEMFGGEIHLIRPLWLVEENLIRKYAKENDFPHQLCRCPFGAHSERKAMKNFVEELSQHSPQWDIRSNIIDGLLRLKAAFPKDKKRR